MNKVLAMCFVCLKLCYLLGADETRGDCVSAELKLVAYGKQPASFGFPLPACLFPLLVSSVEENSDTLGFGASCLPWHSFATAPCCLFPDFSQQTPAVPPCSSPLRVLQFLAG